MVTASGIVDRSRAGDVVRSAGPSGLRRLPVRRVGLLQTLTHSFERGVNREKFVSFLLIVLLLFAIGGLQLAAGRDRSNTAATGQGDGLRQAVYAVTFLGVLLTSGALTYPRRLFSIPVPLVVTLGYCWLSLAWAISPDMAVRRLILTTMIIWTLFQAVHMLGYRRSLLVMRWVLVVTLVANFAAVAVLPSGIHEASLTGDTALAGDWRGVLPQKNFAGALCVITILAFVFDARRIPLVIRGLIIVGSALFLYKTHSKTSIALLGLSTLVGLCYTRYNPIYRAVVVAALVALLVFAAIVMQAYWDEIIAHFDRQDALTGRGEIWGALFRFIRGHWVLGAGFGSFWGVGAESPIYQLVSAKSWVAALGNGHNGYLDLLTQIGVPGLVLVVLTIIVWPIGVLLTSTTIDRGRGALVLSVLLFCATQNMTETSVMDRDMIVQVFWMLTIALLSSLGGSRDALAGRPA